MLQVLPQPAEGGRPSASKPWLVSAGSSRSRRSSSCASSRSMSVSWMVTTDFPSSCHSSGVLCVPSDSPVLSEALTSFRPGSLPFFFFPGIRFQIVGQRQGPVPVSLFGDLLLRSIRQGSGCTYFRRTASPFPCLHDPSVLPVPAATGACYDTVHQSGNHR